MNVMNQATSVLNVEMKSLRFPKCGQGVSAPTTAVMLGGRNIGQKVIAIKARRWSVLTARKPFSSTRSPSGSSVVMLVTLNLDSEEVGIMNKYLIRNEMLYQMSIHPAKIMLEKGLITKAEFRKMKAFLLQKYQPVIPSLLDL